MEWSEKERGTEREGMDYIQCTLTNRPLAMRSTLMTRMMVGLIGMTLVLISSRTIPTMERMTMRISSWFQRSRM